MHESEESEATAGYEEEGKGKCICEVQPGRGWSVNDFHNTIGGCIWELLALVGERSIRLMTQETRDAHLPLTQVFEVLPGSV